MVDSLILVFFLVTKWAQLLQTSYLHTTSFKTKERFLPSAIIRKSCIYSIWSKLNQRLAQWGGVEGHTPNSLDL